MTIHISCRDCVTAKADKQYIRSLSDDFSNYFNNIIVVEWDVKTYGNELLASCRLHSRSGYYRASASSKDLRQAINLVFDKLIKQRRRKKSMKETARRTKIKKQ